MARLLGHSIPSRCLPSNRQNGESFIQAPTGNEYYNWQVQEQMPLNGVGNGVVRYEYVVNPVQQSTSTGSNLAGATSTDQNQIGNTDYASSNVISQQNAGENASQSAGQQSINANQNTQNGASDANNAANSNSGNVANVQTLSY